MNTDATKAAAWLSMLWDHVHQVVLGVDSGVLGRLAFPLFACALAINVARSRDPRALAGRLFWAGVISQAPYVWAFGHLHGNILFTLALGVLAATWAGSSGRRAAALVGLLVAGASVEALIGLDLVAYGCLGVASMVAAHAGWTRRRGLWWLLAGVLLVGANRGSPAALVGVPAALGLLWASRYVGPLPRMRHRAWIWAYPVHLLALVILRP